MEQPPAPEVTAPEEPKDVSSIVEKLPVGESPDLFVEGVLRALDVEANRKPVELALENLFPGEQVHVKKLRRVKGNEFEVLFEVEGQEHGQFLKIQE